MLRRLYEILIALEPAIASGDLEAVSAKIQGAVRDAGGEVKGVEKLGVRKLAFRVSGRSDATFLLLTCELPPQGVRAVEGVLRLHESVIRYMNTRLDPAFLVPSAVGAGAKPAA